MNFAIKYPHYSQNGPQTIKTVLGHLERSSFLQTNPYERYYMLVIYQKLIDDVKMALKFYLISAKQAETLPDLISE